jgi:hypothetical protein
MQPITIAQLESVTGGAGPGDTNNLSAWLPQGGGGSSGGGGASGEWGSSGASFGTVTPGDNRAIVNPPNPQFGESRTPNASPSNQSWQQGLPGMFSAMGM